MKLSYAGLRISGRHRYPETGIEISPVLQQVKVGQSVTGHKQFEYFKQPGCRDMAQQLTHSRNRAPCFRCDGEPQLGGKARRATCEPDLPTVTGFWIADQAQGPTLYVLQAIGVIMDGEVFHAIIECVDGEVAAQCVFFNGAINVVPQDQPVLTALAKFGIGFFLFILFNHEMWQPR